MCWLCDHPEATRFDFLEHVRDEIAFAGFSVQGVSGDRLRSPWAYTVGLTAHGKPELVVTGWSMTRAAQLLHDAGPHLLHADAPRPGEQIWPLGGAAIEIVEVSEPSAHLGIAVAIFGPEIRALQLVHADDRGHWPWEVGFRGGRGGQPVLGVRASRQPADGVASGFEAGAGRDAPRPAAGLRRAHPAGAPGPLIHRTRPRIRPHRPGPVTGFGLRGRVALASMHQFWPFSQRLNRFRKTKSDAKISVGPNLSGILLPAQV